MQPICEILYLVRDLLEIIRQRHPSLHGHEDIQPCVFRLLSTKLQPPGGTTVTAPSGLRTPAGLWAIPSTEPGPQPLLVTYNLSSLALTPGEPTPYVCMYVSMVCVREPN